MMKTKLRSLLLGAAVFLFLLLIFSACNPVPPETPVPQPIEETPSGFQPEAAAPGLLGALIADEPKVIVAGNENPERELQIGESVNIRASERITQDQTAHSVLRFLDDLEIELLRDAEILLVDAQKESGGSLFIRLKQNFGHIRVKLNEQSAVRLTLETADSTLTTLDEGTEFLLCFAPDKITCLNVIEGSVEVTSLGKNEIYRAKEATFYKPGQPPQPPICASPQEVSDWLIQRRSQEPDTPPLSELVASWPKEPCQQAESEEVSEVASTEPAPLPSANGMVYIKPGSYLVGYQPDQFHASEMLVDLPKFWIDQYEVTNSAYQQYLTATNTAEPAVWPGEALHPVQGITYDQAAAFCAWQNKRLPKELEWEVAGRGPDADAPIFPWGNNDPTAGGQTSTLPLNETYEVGTYAFTASPFGVYDLSGNVWEWVTDPYATVPAGTQILRGGRFGFLLDLAYRQPAAANDETFVPLSGFRCAADEVTGEAELLATDVSGPYYDTFTERNSGWPGSSQNSNFISGYHEPEYYHIQINEPNVEVFIPLPEESPANFMAKVEVFLEPTLTGPNTDAIYGLSFRNSGNKYYAFVISPFTKNWAVIKSSPAGKPVVIKQGNSNAIKGIGLEQEDMLRVDANGEIFNFTINDQQVTTLRDPDFPDGNLGFYVRTREHPGAHIHFDSLEVSAP